MNRRIGMALAAVAAVSLAVPTAALAAKEPAPVAKTYFNTPAGVKGTTKAKQFEFTDNLAKAINAVPSPAKGKPRPVIAVGMYSLSVSDVTKALLRADKRGVKVEYLTWHQNNGDEKGTPNKLSGQTLALQKGMKANADYRKKHKQADTGSWFKACYGSCRLDGKAGIHHMKVITFSQTGKATKLTWISSGNATYAAGSGSWNEYTTIDSDKIYASATRYIETSRSDKTAYDFPSVTDQGIHIDYFPHKKLSYDPVLDDLKNARCYKGAKVRYAMFIVTSNRTDIAKQLARLKKEGCDVAAVGTLRQWSNSAESILKKAKVPLYDAAVGDRYLHAKTTVLEVKLKGKKISRTYSGSTNASIGASKQNTDVLLRQDSAAVAKQHEVWFDQVAKASRKQ